MDRHWSTPGKMPVLYRTSINALITNVDKLFTVSVIVQPSRAM